MKKQIIPIKRITVNYVEDCDATVVIETDIVNPHDDTGKLVLTFTVPEQTGYQYVVDTFGVDPFVTHIL